ncbi:MAG: metalloregulator ArsR/SmtB family transcription factor [Candidatus Dormibacteraeota bacterium]|nr:metalloregulator ArsR/SmtB family transcription factor [Candidatus Dormibacteraeota bacterium]
MQVKELPVRQRGVCCEPLAEVDQAWAEETAEVLKALGEPTRLSMIAALWQAEDPICICDFTAALDLSQPTISHHMAKLRVAGLVDSTKRGIWIYYRLRTDLAPATLALIRALLGQSSAELVDRRGARA